MGAAVVVTAGLVALTTPVAKAQSTTGGVDSSAAVSTTAPPVDGAIVVEHEDGSLVWYMPDPERPNHYRWDQEVSVLPVTSARPAKESRSVWSGITAASTMIFLWGFFGQMLFMSRFAVQWFVSERAKKSIVPQAFWWLSLAGAFVLLSYFIIRKEPIGILGQSIGWVIYGRNLLLIYSERRRQLTAEGRLHSPHAADAPAGVPSQADPPTMPGLHHRLAGAPPSDGRTGNDPSSPLAEDQSAPASRANGEGGTAPPDAGIQDDSDPEIVVIRRDPAARATPASKAADSWLSSPRQ